MNILAFNIDFNLYFIIDLLININFNALESKYLNYT
jgi:hypothetical protein